MPAIEFTHTTGEASRRRRVVHRPYNIDFNTMLSTFEQLQASHSHGHRVTPAEIKAMLTVTPPDDVEIGESVQIEVPVEEGSEHR